MAPDYVAHNFMRDVTEPGASKDRILIRLSLLHWKKKMINDYIAGGDYNKKKRCKTHLCSKNISLRFI